MTSSCTKRCKLPGRESSLTSALGAPELWMPSSPSDSSRLPANRKEEAPEELRKSVLPKYVHGTCSHARPCANSCKLLPARPLQLKLSWNARRAEMAVEQHDGSSPAFENVNMSTSVRSAHPAPCHILWFSPKLVSPKGLVGSCGGRTSHCTLSSPRKKTLQPQTRRNPFATSPGGNAEQGPPGGRAPLLK